MLCAVAPALFSPICHIRHPFPYLLAHHCAPPVTAKPPASDTFGKFENRAGATMRWTHAHLTKIARQLANVRPGGQLCASCQPAVTRPARQGVRCWQSIFHIERVFMEYTALQDEIKAAMKARDNARRDILRQVHTELKAIEVNERRDVTQADVDTMLKRVIKQTKETLEGSIKAGNNQERTDLLSAQVAILEEYLPKQVSGAELTALIDEVLAETGAASKKEMGRVMGALTQRTGGNFDKAAAAAELGGRLS
jgi:hypothetical protein